MEPKSQLIRLDHAPDTQYFFCRHCPENPNHIALGEDFLRRVGQTDCGHFKNAVNIKVDDPENYLGKTFAVVRCSICMKNLGLKTIGVDTTHALHRQAEKLYLQLDSLLLWDGTQVREANSCSPSQNDENIQEDSDEPALKRLRKDD